MRIPADMPRRRPQSNNRRRTVLLVIAAVLVVLFTLSSSIAGFYTDYLWFRDLDTSRVFTTVLGTRTVLTLLFFGAGLALVLANLVIADRIAPRGPRRALDEAAQRYRETVGEYAGKVRIGVAVMFALALSSGVSTRWHDLLLFRNRVSFGERDPQFDRDVGFYMFDLPFRSFVVAWVVWALFITLAVTAAAHYLNGGIRLQPGPARGLSPGAKAHLSVLAAGIAFSKAYAYWLDRYELVFSNRSAVGQGAFYTDVNARLPALTLLVLISLAAGVLLLVNIWWRGVALPGVALGSFLVVSILVGTLYPAVTQQFRVKPAESEREAPFIERNIAATRAAMGLDDIEVRNIDFTDAPGSITGGDLVQAEQTVRNIRLWEPSADIALQTLSRQQSLRAYYQITDVDIDRYVIDGRPTQVLIGARELKPDGLPTRNWVNRHLAYTHGLGVVIAPANSATQDGTPAYTHRDLPPVPPLEEPRIYIGEDEGLNEYAIVNTKQPEIDFQRADGRDETSSYAGTRGVELDSPLRRLAFALRFREVNVMISDFITPSSRVLYVRDVRERVQKVAPFLSFDRDPYPVLLEGRIVWVVDAYTSSSRYPYAQPARVGGLRGSNYVRNSVKAVVDAYDGTVTLYAIDPNDPLLRVYQKAFPDLFTARSRLPSGLEAHFRYPEDLFNAQADLLGRYHITNAAGFYSASDAWNVSPDPGAKVADELAGTAAPRPVGGQAPAQVTAAPGSRIPATYLLTQLPGDERVSFSLLLPFVPFGTTNESRVQTLTGYITARSDPGEYGRMVLYRMPTGQQINGPALAAANMEADATVAQQVSLLNREGSRVKFGNIIFVPIKNSIFYVRPLYVEAVQNPVPRLERVIVAFGNRVVISETLQGALIEMFGAAPETLEERAPTDGGTGEQPGGPTGPTPADPTARELITRADAALAAANDALRRGDLGEYKRRVDEAAELVRRAAQASGNAGGGAPPEGGGGAPPEGGGAAPPPGGG